MKTKQPNLGANLRILRELREEGIRLAADRAGISRGLLSKIERGADMQLSTLNKILRSYDMELRVRNVGDQTER